MITENVLCRSDMLRCVLCTDAPCTSVCTRLDPASILRSIWFDNEKCAAAKLPDTNPCIECSAPCETACLRCGQVPVRELIGRMYDEIRPALDAAAPQNEERLKTSICGVPLENPFLLSSSAVSATYDMCARAFEAGWAGAAFKTVSTFDVHEASPRFSAVYGNDGAITGFKNIEQLSDHSVEENMAVFRQLKENYPSKVLIASIMGQNEAEWEQLAAECEANGADIIELNFSCPHLADKGYGSDIGQDPEAVRRFTAAARRGTQLPILAKLTPNVDTMVPMAQAAREAGANGIAAINTIKSVTNVNPHTYVSAPAVHGRSSFGGYSGLAVKPIGLRFIAEMRMEKELSDMELSAMGGIETWLDALEYILMGANSLQVTTAVMQYGYRIIDDLKAGLNYYMAEKGIRHIADLVGEGIDSLSANPDHLEKDSVLFPRFMQDRCIGCGRCVVSCADGGHQALHLNNDRRPVLDGKKCVGCHLCILVCPQKAIRPSSTRIIRNPQ